MVVPAFPLMIAERHRPSVPSTRPESGRRPESPDSRGGFRLRLAPVLASVWMVSVTAVTMAFLEELPTPEESMLSKPLVAHRYLDLYQTRTAFADFHVGEPRE